MYSTLAVHFLPELTTPEELAAGVVVVIDVLRASTTITTALAAGARELIACAEVEQARQWAAELGRHRQASAKALVAAATEITGKSAATATPAFHGIKPEPILGGERGGLPIEGFDIGNSPCEYTQQTVAGKTIVFTTTNGTQALLICSAAQRVLIGSFVNFSAVLQELTGKLPIHLLCAGTRCRITREDVLFAGALVEKLAGTIVEQEAINDEACIARDVWCNAMGSIRPPGRRANQRLAEVLHECQGGHNLINVGLQRDIAAAADFDRYNFVPVFDAAHWRIAKPAP